MGMKTILALVFVSSFAFSQYNAGLKGVESVTVDVASRDRDGVLLLDTDETANMMKLLLKVTGITVSEESDYSLVIQINAIPNGLCEGSFVYLTELSVFRLTDNGLVSVWKEGFLGVSEYDKRPSVLVSIDNVIRSFIHAWKRDNGLIGKGF